MDIDRAKRFHDLLDQTLNLAPDERRAFLEKACGDDLALVEELWTAVQFDDDLGEFMERPAHRSGSCRADGSSRP